jgi:hypothetical protein
MRRQMLVGAVSCALMSAVLAQPAAPDAKGQPTATLDVASEQMRLIMGGTAGKGVLHFNGKDYPFSFKSASVGVGAKMVTKVSATGKVYGLKRIEDFGGQYASVSQSTMAGSAAVTATYKNDKGVTIDLRGTTEGAGLSLGGGVATVVTLAK